MPNRYHICGQPYAVAASVRSAQKHVRCEGSLIAAAELPASSSLSADPQTELGRSPAPTGYETGVRERHVISPYRRNPRFGRLVGKRRLPVRMRGARGTCPRALTAIARPYPAETAASAPILNPIADKVCHYT